jgi:hypothetical protein
MIPNLLRPIKVSEISLVKRGANQFARVLYYKRAEGTMPHTTANALAQAILKAVCGVVTRKSADGRAVNSGRVERVFTADVATIAKGRRRSDAELEEENAEPADVQASVLSGREADQLQGTSDVVGGGKKRRGRARDRMQGTALVEGRFGKAAEPITKQDVASAMDSYVERQRLPGETTAAAHARLGQEDPLYRQLYTLHTRSPAPALPVELPREEPRELVGVTRKATELQQSVQKSGKRLTKEQAVAKALTENPDIYEDYLLRHPEQCGRA